MALWNEARAFAAKGQRADGLARYTRCPASPTSSARSYATVGGIAGSAGSMLGGGGEREECEGYLRALQFFQQGAALCHQGEYPAGFAKEIQTTQSKLGM